MNTKSNVTFHQLLCRYIPYWPLFVVLVSLSSFLAWSYVRSLTPVYEASASILITDEEEGSGESKIMESFDLLSSKKSVQNEIEVIRSKSLMREVVKKLHLYTPVYKEEKSAPVYLYDRAPVIIKAAYPEKLRGEARINFSVDVERNEIKLMDQVYQLDKWVQTPYGLLRFERNSLPNALKAGNFFFSSIQPAVIANQLRASLNVAPMAKTSMVVLRIKDPIAKRAEDVLNALAESYNKASLNEKNSLASNTLNFVEDRIKYVEEDLDSLEKKIQFFKSSEGIVDLGNQGGIYLQSLSSNDQKAAGINLQLAILEQVEKYVKSKENTEGLVPSTMGLQEPLLTDLLQRLYNAELEYERLKKTTAENNPALLTLRSQIDKIRPGLLENIESQKKVLKASLNKISAENNSYASRLSALPRKEKALLDLNRQQAIKSSVYTFLLQKREETALSSSATVADNRLIDAAETYMIPPSPSKPVVYLLAIVFGVLSSVGIVSAKELLNTKVLFRSEIESFTKIPVVAEISTINSKGALILNKTHGSIVLEQFRQLRAAIGLYGKVRSKRRLLVTSSITGEGKSFVSSNLALSLAQAGRRVVLVDLDLRNPKTSELFCLTGSEGVGEYLEGTRTANEIQAKTEFEGLCIIPAGKGKINTIELLLSGKLELLFKELSDQFDYIIADSSPVDPVTDAVVLSDYFDTTLFVIRHGYTPKTMVQLLDDNNKIKALKNTSIVFNGVRRRGLAGKGYGYGYGYGYEYVYKDRVEQPGVAQN